MKKTIFSLLVLATTLVGCTDDYKDWTNPQHNDAEEAMNANLTIAPVDAIDLTDFEDESVKFFNVSSLTNPDGLNVESYQVVVGKVDENGEVTDSKQLTADTDYKVNVASLKEVIKSFYGQYPTTRDIKTVAKVYLKDSKTGNTYVATSNEVDNHVTPENFGTAYKLVYNDGEEVELTTSEKNYPEFNVSFTATTNSSWTIYNADGDPVYEGEIANGGKYNLTYNAESVFASAEKVPSFLYMKGNANGWDGYDAMECINEEGTQFRGFMYLDQDGFKFCTQTNWDGTNYGKDFSTAGDAANIVMTEPAGYYQVDVDLNAKTYTLTPITTIGIIGAATPGGWDADTDLTYNATERCWEIKGIQLTEGNYKFRANDAWAIQWGLNSETGEYVFSSNAPEATCTEAGTYDIKLYAWANGFAKCEVTKK